MMKYVAVVARRRLVVGKVRLACQEVGLPIRIYGDIREIQRENGDANAHVIVLDGTDEGSGIQAIRSLVAHRSAPLLLIGTTNRLTVQIRQATHVPTDCVPDPFYVEEVAAKLSLLVEKCVSQRANLHRFSDRQMEVLEMLARGEPNEAIAHHCCIETGTVKTHVRTVLSKLGARNRTEAVAIAKDLALI